MAAHASPPRTIHVVTASPGDLAGKRRGFKWVLVLLWLAIAGVVLWAAALFVIPRYLRYAAIEELKQLGEITVTGERVRFRAVLPDQESFDRLGVLLRRVRWTSLDLAIENSKVSDLSPLAGLSGLTTLNLDGTQVRDLSPLAGLSGLIVLSLDGTQVSDLSPLAGLSGLTVLSLDYMQVSDLSPLAGLRGLTVLSLWSTPVGDLSPLAGLSGLTELYLGHAPVSDLSPLARLSGLTELNLERTQVSDLSPIAGLSRLRKIVLSGGIVVKIPESLEKVVERR